MLKTVKIAATMTFFAFNETRIEATKKIKEI